MDSGMWEMSLVKMGVKVRSCHLAAHCSTGGGGENEVL